MRRLAAFLLVALAVGASGPASAQVTPERDVRLEGRSVVGRWRAVELVGDGEATEDLREGTLTTALVINPTGHVILRGSDRRQGGGAATSFSGQVEGGRVHFRDLPGEAEIEILGGRLHLVDPYGRRTVFVRER